MIDDSSVEGQSPQESREVFLASLKERIDQAFDNRKQVPLNTTHDVEPQFIDFARKRALEVRDLPDDTVLELGEFEEKPHEVFVDDPDDYPELIRIAFERLVKEGHLSELSEDEIEREKERIIKHETEGHGGVDKGGENLEIRFGISFFEEPPDVLGQPVVGITPLTNLSGNITTRLYKDIWNNPDDPSSADKEFRRESARQ